MGLFSWLFGKDNKDNKAKTASNATESTAEANKTTATAEAATTKTSASTATESATPQPQHLKPMRVTVHAPCRGTVILPEYLTELVWTETHAVGINPGEGTFFAPIAGTVTELDVHGYTVETKYLSVRVNFSLCTDGKKPEAVAFFVQVGDEVTIDKPILKADLEAVLASGISTISYVTCDNLQVTAQLRQQMQVGDDLGYVDVYA